MAGRIFVSYRRSDTAGYAHLVYTLLRKEFGAENVFMDVDTIQPGQDFVETLDRAVRSSDVLIVLIGPRWLNIRDEHGARRLDDPNDFVKVEITSALNYNKKVIPVLFDRADMPGEDQLPADLKPLARRQAVRIGEHAADDIRRVLIKSIKQAIQERQRPKISLRQVTPYVLIIGACLFLASGLAVLFGRDIFNPSKSQSPTEAAGSGETQSVPVPSVGTPGQVPAMQWRIDDDRAVIEQEEKYWEKYAADTNPPGLYLRTDNVNAFGDFLELNSDSTFTLEENGIAQTGTWKIEGNTLTLVFP